MSGWIGEVAALLTAFCWAFNSVVFTLAGRRVGSVTVNALRLWIAVPALLLVHWFLYATPFPFAIEPARFLWLGASGPGRLRHRRRHAFRVLPADRPAPGHAAGPAGAGVRRGAGLGVPGRDPAAHGDRGHRGDPRRHRLGGGREERRRRRGVTPRRYGRGVWLAIGGAAGQAVGLLFSRQGLAGGYSAISATLVRVSVAAVILALAAFARGALRRRLEAMKDRKALLEITAGALTGPALGVILSLVAIAHASIGVASTLMSLTPVLLLPVSHFLFRERISARAVAGTVMALLGVVLLFLT